jgi:mono/diheme cytochrome c family protein
LVHHAGEVEAGQSATVRAIYDGGMKAGLAFVLLACMAAGASAQDVSRGALLYETHCIACHREGLHDRRNSKVATYADLRFQVERWTAQTGRAFTASEREDLIEFLDASHYRLDRRQSKP